ncbi:hypothetical protein IAU60_001532 [Kwoniella sp. DSM 27419]
MSSSSSAPSPLGGPPRRPAKRETNTVAGGTVPRDPAIDRALQLSNFESNYGTEDFISSLSEKLISESKADPGPFNPKPFLQTFSPALDSLLALRQQVAERTKKMETEVRRAEREYGRRLRELDGGFETIGNSFSNLETRITDVGRTAVRIGKDVADNASAALAEAESSATPGPANGEESGKSENNPREAAPNPKLISKRRIEKEKAERVRDEIERYCEKFEKEVLRLFDRSYRKGDPRMMAHCAKTLQDFNGGASCVQIYVNQHDFFISKDRLLEEAVNPQSVTGEDGEARPADLWTSIGNPDLPPPTTEPGMEALVKEIRVTVSQEAQIVKAVFPNPSAVLQVFLQRIFAQVIQQHLESLLSRAATISTLAVLRLLHLTHSVCAALVDDLKMYDLTLGNSATGSSKTSTAAGGPLASMLDHALEEMFVPWLEGTRYLESESKNLVELYAGLLSRFTRYHETVLKAKPNSLLDKVVNQLATSSTAATSSSTAQTAAAAISKYANLFTSSGANRSAASSSVQAKPFGPNAAHLNIPGTGARTTGADTGGTITPIGRPGLQRQDTLKGELVNKGLEDKVWSVDGILTIEMAERMLKWHAEAVGRAVELSVSGDIGKNALAMSKVLAEAIGRSFIETALDSSLARLESHDSRSEPDLQPLSVLKPADQICHLWQRYSSTALLPLAGSTVAIRREMGTFNSHNIVRMEGKINSVIQKTLDSIVRWLSFLLTKQQKNDYKPKNDDLSFARTITEPCEYCCDFLSTVKDTVNESLSGKNAEAYLTEVGVAFHSLLLDHYKKFPVNPTGGLMLTKDLASYQETMNSYGIPAVNDRFDMLRQLGNSFIVQPNVLKSYMTESHLGRIDARFLRPYLAQRSDYSQFSRSLQLDDGPLPTTAEEAVRPISSLSSSALNRASSIGMGSGRFKGSRLSTMSGVAGAGMGKLKEMLKEFDTLSPEEAEAAKKSTNGQSAGRGYQPMFYMGMH